MPEEGGVLVESFVAYTIGILVYFVGARLNERVPFLRTYNIPEPVTGGILASVAVLLVYVTTGTAIAFELDTRDRVLIYFFTAIGLNARVSDLVAGGRPLLVLLALTLGYIVLQNVVGVSVASLMGQPSSVGVLVGSASLIGGHGTAIAWAPTIASEHGIANALEIGVAAATFGLVAASLLGGPIANVLLRRVARPSASEGSKLLVGVPHEDEAEGQIDHVALMSVLLVLHIAIILGYCLNLGLTAAGLRLPLFVACLLVAITLSNTVPHLIPRMHWPARTKALAVVSDFSLGLFISMSLMSMQLWTIADLAGPLLLLLGAQVLCASLFIFGIFFRLMGRDYLATVLSAGFAGFSLGATPTAIANMSAVTKANGPHQPPSSSCPWSARSSWTSRTPSSSPSSCERRWSRPLPAASAHFRSVAGQGLREGRLGSQRAEMSVGP